MEIARSDGLEFLSIPDLVQRALCSICADRQPGDTLPPKPSAVVASNPNECHHTLAAEVSRRKKAEHQAKQITAAMEEAKKAAAKRREEALERLAKEEVEELRRYEADLAKATKASLGTADAEPDAMDPGARASTDPAPATPTPLDAYIRPTGGAAATEDSKWPPLPRPAAKSEARGRQPLRSGSRANAPRAPLTRQAIQTPRYSGAIFSLTATSTSERMMGCSPRLLASAEAPATPSSFLGGLARRYRPERMLSRRAKASSR